MRWLDGLLGETDAQKKVRVREEQAYTAASPETSGRGPVVSLKLLLTFWSEA